MSIIGLSVGEEKPNMDVFFNPIVISLKKLEYGFDLKIENVASEIKFFLIAGVFDKPAKSEVLNMIKCNGFNGCHKCNQPGISHRATKESGIQHIYEFKPEDSIDWKSKRNYADDLKKAIETGKTVNGVKGICILNRLKYYHPIESTCIDYMHSILEGVIKSLFKYWFNSENSTHPSSMRKYMQEIDKRLSNILPPKFVPTTPRSIYSSNLWRAHEYLSFILYYALGVFRDIMPFEYYQYLKKLILFIETILNASIDIDHLRRVELVLIEFVEEVSDLYSPSIMLSGMHELLHIVECTIQFGPLNSINCFQFEELNRKLMRFLHGKDLIGEELINVFSTAQVLSSFSTTISNTKVKDFVTTRMCFKSCNIKKQNKGLINISYKQLANSNNPVSVSLFNRLTNKRLVEVNTCLKIKMNGIVYNSHHHKTKRCDSCFISKNNQIGIIELFIIDENKVYVISKKLVQTANSFYSNKYRDLKSNLIICNITNEFIIQELKDIRKIVLINISEDNCFVSLFNSSHLFN